LPGESLCYRFFTKFTVFISNTMGEKEKSKTSTGYK